jgi:hypothetical protein
MASDSNQLQYELLTLAKAVDELRGNGLRNVVRLLGAVAFLGGIILLGFNWISDRQVKRLEKGLLGQVQAGKQGELQGVDAEIDPAQAALRAAKAAMHVASQCKEKVVVKYLPTLDMFYYSAKDRPLLSSPVLGSMFDGAASPHPTTPSSPITAKAKGSDSKEVTWKGLDRRTTS